MWPQHTLQMFADYYGPRHIPFHEIPFIRDCCNHKGGCTLVSPCLTIAAGISSLSCTQLRELGSAPWVEYKTISSEFLVQGNFKRTQFSRGTDGTRTRNLSHRKWALYRMSYLGWGIDVDFALDAWTDRIQGITMSLFISLFFISGIYHLISIMSAVKWDGTGYHYLLTSVLVTKTNLGKVMHN